MNNQIREERMLLVKKAAEFVAQWAREHTPEVGPFRGSVWSLKYPGTCHEPRLSIQHSASFGCVIRASVVAEGTDWEVSNYMFFGSKAECIAWLGKEGSHQALVEAYAGLIDRTDEEF